MDLIKKIILSGVNLSIILVLLTCNDLTTEDITGGSFLSDSDINIKQSDISYAAGGVYDLGSQEIGTSSMAVTFFIENKGIMELELNGNPIIAVSDNDASMFTLIQPVKTLLAPGESVSFEITFSPTITEGVGNKFATIKIESNDINDSIYSLLIMATSIDTLPIEISDKTITVSDADQTSMNLSWNKASDNLTSEENLEYSVYYSTTGNFDTVIDIEANFDTLILSQKNINSLSVNGLTEGVTYYFNIIVKDEQGNMTAYNKVSQKTIAVAEMIADINDGTEDSIIISINEYGYEYFIVYNGKLFFAANDGNNGKELWVYNDQMAYSTGGDSNNPLCSDGDNPCMVADINTGADSSSPANFVVYNNGSGDKLYFSATDGDDDEETSAPYGRELWVYDGSNAPSMVANIRLTGQGAPKHLTVLEGKLYFSADNGPNGSELWVYDGGAVTDGGNGYGLCSDNDNPCIVADIIGGMGGSSPTSLTVFNSKLHFSANDGTNGAELWVYDGGAVITGGATTFCSDGNNPCMVADINNGGYSVPKYLTVYNNNLYFNASNGSSDYELWVYDYMKVISVGTNCSVGNNPCRVADISASMLGGNPKYLTVFNNNLYFSANEDVNGLELWDYDDQVAVSGTNPEMVVNINSNNQDSSTPEYLTTLSSKLYFSATDGVNGRELWVYDGTTASMAVDITGNAGDSDPEYLIEYNGSLYFSANDGVNGRELWRYNP